MIIHLTCPFCGFSKNVQKEKIPSHVRGATCPRCRQRFEIPKSKEDLDFLGETTQSGTTDRNAPVAEKGSSRKGAPWENRSELELWQRIVQTLKAVLFSPSLFFRRLSTQGGIGEPLAFGLLTGSIGGMFSVFWQLLMLAGGLLSLGGLISGQLTSGMIFLILVVVIPLTVIVRMFISSAVLHLFLLLLRGADNGFETTFRVVSYSQSVQLLGIIPFVGGWISLIWRIIIQIIGLKEMHETSYLKAVLAFIIPFSLVMVIIISIAILLIYFIGSLQLGQLWS